MTTPDINLHYQVLSALLSYPQQELLDALPELEAAVADGVELAAEAAPLFAFLRDNDLIALQENYVATFDRNPKHSLHLFEHVHGESRDRGQAMVDLIEEYRRHGLDMASTELPDYVPLFLEFLAQIEPDAAGKLLGDAIHVLAQIGNKLESNGSPYHHLFAALCGMTDVEPHPLEEPPVRDMDEALEVFGPGADGVEPLLKPSATQTVQFYPKQPGNRACAA